MRQQLFAIISFFLVGCAVAELPPVAEGAGQSCPLLREAYAVFDVDLPLSAAAAQRLAFDLDGDPLARPDNAGGRALAAFVGAWADAEAGLYREIGAALESGWLAWLITVDRCADGAGGYVGVGLQRGTFTGSGYRLLAERAPAAGWQRGQSIMASAGRGLVPVSLLMDFAGLAGDVAWSDGDGMTVELEQTTESELEGRIGIGLGEAAPVIAATVMADFYTAKLGEGSSALGQDLDRDGDGRVTPAEVVANPAIAALLAVDVDLMSEDVYAPRQDGVVDRYSFAFGVYATRVDLVTP